MKKILLGILACFLPTIGITEELYRVEILVFAQPEEATDSIRRFEEAPELDIAPIVDFRQHFCLPAGPKLDFLRRFASEEAVADCLGGYLRLNELRQPMVTERIRLEKSGQYRILHHAAWQQPVTSPDEAHQIRLTNGRTLAQASSDAPVVDGSLRLSREQFLQIDLKILYYYPNSESRESSATDGLLFQVSRKLRSGDLNYLDHPVIGILAQVTEVKENPNVSGVGASPRIAVNPTR